MLKVWKASRTKRLLLRPNTNATWITTHQIETYSTPYMYTIFATSTEHIYRYASTCAHSHTMRARTMRAYANARIRISLHANAFLMRHASIRIRYLGVFRVRYARICAHSHAMRAHSHRMRSHSHRMRSHRMRMRAFKGNLCVSGTVLPKMRCHLQISSYRIDLTSVNGPISPKQCYYEMGYSFYTFNWLDSLEIWLDHNSTYYRSLSKNSDVKRRTYFILRSQSPQYKTHPEFWPSHSRIFKTSLYYKTRLILETRRYIDTLDNRFIFYIDRQH